MFVSKYIWQATDERSLLNARSSVQYVVSASHSTYTGATRSPPSFLPVLLNVGQQHAWIIIFIFMTYALAFLRHRIRSINRDIGVELRTISFCFLLLSLSSLYFGHMCEDVFFCSLFVIRETERENGNDSSLLLITRRVQLNYHSLFFSLFLSVRTFVTNSLHRHSPKYDGGDGFTMCWLIDLHSCSLISSATCWSTVDI